jgi:hypothetical protein
MLGAIVVGQTGLHTGKTLCVRPSSQDGGAYSV